MVLRRSNKSAYGQKSGGFFSNLWNGIKSAATWVANGIKGVVSTVHKDVRDVVSAVNTNVRDAASGVKNYVTHTQDSVVSVVNTAVKETAGLGKALGDDATKVASSMSLPLMIGGAAALAFVLLK